VPRATDMLSAPLAGQFTGPPRWGFSQRVGCYILSSVGYPGILIPDKQVVHDVSCQTIVDKHYVYIEVVHILNMSNSLLVGVNTECSFGDMFIFNISRPTS
jgi:hypothetical protein